MVAFSVLAAGRPVGPSSRLARVICRRWSRRHPGSAGQSSGSAGSSRKRSFLGTTAGTALVFLSGSVFVWPLADLCLGPALVQLGMLSKPTASVQSKPEAGVAATLDMKGSQENASSVTVMSGDARLGKDLEHAASEMDRPVVYISLREATSPHDLYFAALAGVYSLPRLGFLGTSAHSVGTWWIILFDIIVGHDPDETRAMNLFVIFQHLKRALTAVQSSRGAEERRPLVILDHIGAVTLFKDAPSMRSMLTHLVAWCAAACYDNDLADIVMCREHIGPSWRASSPVSIQNFHHASTFQEHFKREWSL